MTAVALNAASTIQKNPAAAAALVTVDIFAEFATDSALENGGSWVTLRGATRLLIGREHNTNFSDRIAQVMEENEEALKADTEESRKLSRKLLCQVLAETVLLGWENLDYKGKKNVPYSVELATEMLDHNDFRAYVRGEAGNRSHYKAKLEDDAAKN